MRKGKEEAKGQATKVQGRVRAWGGGRRGEGERLGVVVVAEGPSSHRSGYVTDAAWGSPPPACVGAEALL